MSSVERIPSSPGIPAYSNGQPFDSTATRAFVADEIKKRMDGKMPYEWQIDVGEALHLGIDTVLVARTGAGKTLPFAIAALLGGTVIILLPLNALQDDQVRQKRSILVFKDSHA